MPFLSFRKSLESSFQAAETLMRAGAQALKLEGVDGHEEFIQKLVQSGVPVMGHLGLTPQSVHALGGFKVQGREKIQAEKLKADALKLQDLGVFSLVLECVPSPLANQVTQSLKIPTIGIGAGADTDGQVLVLQDLLGSNPDFHPHFLKTFANIHQIIGNAIGAFDQQVKTGEFPSIQESYE